MTDQDLTIAPGDRDNLIQQIALTNQVGVPWEELKAVLKLRFNHILESKVLTYTEPTVTNPLTIRMTPLSSNDSTSQSGLSPAPAPAPPPAAVVSSAPPKEHSHVEESQDQAHVPEQTLSETKEEKNKEGSEQTVQEATEKKSSPSPETEDQPEKPSESQGSPEGTATQNDISTTATTNSNSQGAAPNGPTLPETATAVSPESGSNMVPICKDTLLVETPEGYHRRINGLLDVLMITSSINEFSNPAYNGSSALDEDTSATAGEKAAVTVNGDYSRARTLDFDLITETVATPNLTDAVEQNVSAQGDDQVEPFQEDSTTTKTADQDQDQESTLIRESENTVTGGGTTSDMDVEVTIIVSMEGIETDDTVGQDESSDIQLDNETDRGMEVDQP
ncbi:hypothetical protein BGZ65_001967 [Modicella reniformis]|uniref:Uncharacterized protein n=1 Tax=Modicella reniformis TaxID=1440133 RepID=A0A9P6M9R7_9FUNG|nr:hypothetical protein BGZ65_001967 [Modicella reniformis]